MSIFLMTASEVSRHVATKMRERRLAKNLTQKTLAERSGVSYAVVKQFEQSGKIAFLSLLKLALVLGHLEDFDGLFNPPGPENYPSLASYMNTKKRKRGRE